MSLWLFRAGRVGEYEEKFLSDNRIYLTWQDLAEDLSRFTERITLGEFLIDFYEDHKKNTVRNWLSQIWPMVHEMQPGDWVVLPSKRQSTIHFGKVTGPYRFDASAQNPFYHYRTVEWFAHDVPRTAFDQDLLYSFGAFMTVCRIRRNDAEERIQRVLQKLGGSAPVTNKSSGNSDSVEEAADVESDIEQAANDQLAKHLERKYAGHGMARLVEAILKAKGYTTYFSKPGPDGGVDILAGPQPMGFGRPRICVQVKSGNTSADKPTLDRLIGTMQNVGADQGLLVSWSDFNKVVEAEEDKQFFRVRLWRQKDIISELLQHYDDLDDELKSELPLKRIWTLSLSEE